MRTGVTDPRPDRVRARSSVWVFGFR